MELSWQLCPYCGTSIPGARINIKSPPSALENDEQGIGSTETSSEAVDI